jgi:hypothetical protein
MKYRKLRIAWSVVWGLAVMLLVVLWVRSYWWLDGLKGKPLKYRMTVSSVSGKIVFESGSNASKFWTSDSTWELSSDPVDKSSWLWPLSWIPDYSRLGISFYYFKDQRAPLSMTAKAYWFLILPHCYAIALTALIGGMSWLPWSKRFSIRTMLIAFTLVAVLFGLFGRFR